MTAYLAINFLIVAIVISLMAFSYFFRDDFHYPRDISIFRLLVMSSFLVFVAWSLIVGACVVLHDTWLVVKFLLG